MVTFHLNDYPIEKRFEIMDKIAAEIFMMFRYALNEKDLLWKMSYEIKNTGTSDPTITISGNDICEVYGVHTRIEI